MSFLTFLLIMVFGCPIVHTIEQRLNNSRRSYNITTIKSKPTKVVEDKKKGWSKVTKKRSKGSSR